MGRVLGAVSAALALVLLVACAPDVVPITGPTQVAPPPDVVSLAPAPACGDDAGGPDQDTRVLSSTDVWPAASYTGQGVHYYTLDPAACQGRLAATPVPLRPACQDGFPYFGEDDMLTEMARIGVTHIIEVQDDDMRADGTTVSTVNEMLLDLGDGAPGKLAAFVTECGAKLRGGYYSTTGSVGDTLLQIEPEFAVAMTFDRQATLTAAQRLDLLHRAVSIAAA